MRLDSLGWDSRWEAVFLPLREAEREAARVAMELRGEYILISENGEVPARCAGKLMHRAESRRDYPAVGDWVVMERKAAGPAVIHAVLPRCSLVSRPAIGKAVGEQLLAANVNTLFLVTGLDLNYNLRRIERFLAATRGGGAETVVLLNKADLRADAEAVRSETASRLGRVPVILTSAVDGTGMEEATAYLRPGETIALLGSSGAGKSSLVNRLCGTVVQSTAETRESDNRGRHTTTSRHLVPLPGGAWLLDTPGLREFGLWEAETGLKASFRDLEELAATCRFGDCGHLREPGCAVRAAVEEGVVSPTRLANWLKLVAEQAAGDNRRRESDRKRETSRWRAKSRPPPPDRNG